MTANPHTSAAVQKGMTVNEDKMILAALAEDTIRLTRVIEMSADR